MSSKCFTFIVVVFVIYISCEVDQSLAQNDNNARATRRRFRARTRPESEGLANNLRRAYFSAVTSDAMTPANNWQDYAPSVPSREEVDCYVEVIETRLQGGRCIQLGSIIPQYICQSGAHIAFNTQCEQVIQTRQTNNNNNNNVEATTTS